MQHSQQKPINHDNEHQETAAHPDGIIAGVCGGLAEFFGLTSLIRIATLILILFGGSIWVYIILWLIVPKAQAITE
ncbi:MAG: PspC domain-containing protein [Alistipes sp.]